MVVLVLFSVPFTLFAAKEVKVEVLYMNHGPLQASLKEIKNVFFTVREQNYRFLV